MSAIYGLIGIGGATVLSAMGDRLAHRGGARIELAPGGDAWLGAIASSETVPVTDQQERSLLVADADLFGREITPALAVAKLHEQYLTAGAQGLASLDGHFAFAK